MHIVHLYRVHSTCRGAELEDFIMQVSTFYPALQFTYTISQTQIPFLDITLSVSGSRISLPLHCKDTDIHNYLHQTSSHPKHLKNGIPYSQFLRLCRLCSEDDDFLLPGDVQLFQKKPWLSLRLGKGCPLSPAKRNVCVETKEEFPWY